MEINLVGSVVVGATLRGVTTLNMGDRGSVYILTPLRLTEPSGVQVSCDPLDYTDDPKPFDAVVGRRVMAASLSDDGRFTLAFEGGSVLSVPPFEGSESVNIVLPDSPSMVVVGFNGQISSWD
jgi:hypothetical protein